MIYDVAIIGTGPAGLAAAIYASRAGLNCIMFEKTGMNGGQILNTYDVDNYPGLPSISGFDLAMKMKEHVDKFDVIKVDDEIKSINIEEKLKKLITENEEYLAKTIIIATGANYAKLGVSGENQFSGKGVSYCATCDGAFFRNKVTAVIGGGDVAVEDAIFLSRACEKVYLIHRRNELRAAKILQKSLLETSNIEVIWDSVVTKIEGDQIVNGLQVQNVKDQTISRMDVSGVFIAVGTIPNSHNFAEILDIDEKGYIIAGENCETNVPGVYVAGDVRTKQLRQIITATADGANAVTSVERYLVETSF